MSHAISPAGAAEAAHYADIAKDERREAQSASLTQRMDEIFDAFDAQDAAEALALAAEHGRDGDLNAALAACAQLHPQDERPAVRALLQAVRQLAHYYAGYQAQQEVIRARA